MSNTTFNYDAVADRYDEWYATPQGKAIDRLEKESFLKHLSKIPKKTVIVEAGAGTGHWSQFMVAQGYMVVGIDISEDVVDEAKKTFPQIEFYVGDICNLNFKENSNSSPLLLPIQFFCIVKTCDGHLPSKSSKSSKSV